VWLLLGNHPEPAAGPAVESGLACARPELRPAPGCSRAVSLANVSDVYSAKEQHPGKALNGASVPGARFTGVAKCAPKRARALASWLRVACPQLMGSGRGGCGTSPGGEAAAI
jgi:hypothetical protein